MLDILFHFFVSIPMDSLILFHMIQKVPWISTVWCAADSSWQNTHIKQLSQWIVLMLVATCGGVTSNWAVWELHICEHLTHAFSSGFVFLTNATVLNLGSNNVTNANSSTLITMTNFLAIPNSRWCHILCTGCSCACSWFCWIDGHICQWRQGCRFGNVKSYQWFNFTVNSSKCSLLQ
jgi:hypothetical protein